MIGRFGSTLITTLCAYACLCAPSLAQSQSAGPITARAYIEGDSTSVGMPIVLVVDLANNSAHTLDMLAGWPPNLGAATYTLLGPSGRPESARASYGPHSRSSSTAAVQGARIPDLFRPNTTRRVRVVLSRFVEPRTAGRYVVSVRLNLPYQDIGTDDVGYGPTAAFQTDIRLPLTVGPAEPTALAQEAAHLFTTIAESMNRPTEGLESLDALFTMPGETAARFWRALATDTARFGSIRGWVLARLHGVGTRAAVDILAQMWDANSLGQQGIDARSALVALYCDGDPTLHQYIGAIFIRREGHTPPVPSKTAPRIEVNAG